MKIDTLSHRFVHHIPRDLDDGVLYVSMEFATVVHRCCCGCGNEVTTPLSPFKWQMRYDGRSVSLTPSIGNSSFPCRSHYFIEHDGVRWLPPLLPVEIAAARDRDRQEALEALGDTAARAAWWSRLWRRVRRR